MPKLAISLLLYLTCFYAVGYGAGYITGGITWHTLYMLERIITVALAYFHERRSLNNFHRDRVITFEQIAE
ncbi:hypothetical protein QU856_14365, partial [Escherichia coli]